MERTGVNLAPAQWTDLLRVLSVGVCGYVALIAMLRLSGKRTLSKMNMFDFVVTVALGSTLATLILSKDTSLLEGLTAFAVLIGAQYGIAWLSLRSARFQNLIKAEPTLLVHRGEYMENALRRERMTREEILAAVRAAGLASVDQAGGVVLETDGSVSVLREASGDSYATVEKSPGTRG